MARILPRFAPSRCKKTRPAINSLDGVLHRLRCELSDATFRPIDLARKMGCEGSVRAEQAAVRRSMTKESPTGTNGFIPLAARTLETRR